MTLVTIDDKNAWDKFIDSSPYGTLFHKWDFLKTVEKHTGYKLIPYAAFKGSEITCALPLFFKRTMGVNMVFSPPPQTCIPYLGFVMTPMYDSLKQRKKESYLNNAIDEIEGGIQKLAPNYISIVTVPGFVDARPFEWKNYSVNADFTYEINLAKTMDQILNDFDKDCRTMVRESLKGGFRIALADDVDAFYEMMRERYLEQKLNFPVISAEYLKDLLDLYPDNLKLYSVYYGEELASAGAIYQYKDKYLQWVGGVNLKKELPTIEYFTWELIKMAKDQGYKFLDFGGANTSRLCDYKAKYNPSLKQYYSISKKSATGRIAEWGYSRVIKQAHFNG